MINEAQVILNKQVSIGESIQYAIPMPPINITRSKLNACLFLSSCPVYALLPPFPSMVHGSAWIRSRDISFQVRKELIIKYQLYCESRTICIYLLYC